MTAVKQLVPKSRGPPVHLLSILSSLGRLNSSAHVRVSATQLLAAEKCQPIAFTHRSLPYSVASVLCY